MKPTIAAAVVALNEERRLPALLDSLQWVDEIVVVDGGSRDATAAIARRRGCRVAVVPFDGFARQRNRALDLARGEWVLSIDCDERPTPSLVAEIGERIARGRAAAYRVPIRSTIFGRRMRFGGTQDDRPVRLFRRAAARWSGEVHEVLRIAGRVDRLRGWLEHETLPDLASFLVKMRRYTALEAEARVVAGRAPRRRDAWLAPPREVFRRLLWKHGYLDGPRGWAFCLLSGFSEAVLAHRHRRAWAEAQAARATSEPRPSRCAATAAEFDAAAELLLSPAVSLL